MQYNYEELLELKTLKGYTPIEQVSILGFLFDTSLDEKNLSGIELGLSLSNQIDIAQYSKFEIILFHYYVSNGWASRRILKAHSLNNVWDFQLEEISKGIYHLRKAISSDGFDMIGAFRQCQIFTNLGNLFNFIGDL